MKLTPILLMALILITPALATTQIQISEDNLTWVNINSTLYQGGIDEITKIAAVNQLSEDTNYYVRARNETADWSYLELKTNGGLKEMIIMFIALTTFAFIFLLFGMFVENPILFRTISSTIFIIVGLMLIVQGIEDIQPVFSNGLGIIEIAVGSYLGLTILKEHRNREE